MLKLCIPLLLSIEGPPLMNTQSALISQLTHA